jgi:hypothetical protein
VVSSGGARRRWWRAVAAAVTTVVVVGVVVAGAMASDGDESGERVSAGATSEPPTTRATPTSDAEPTSSTSAAASPVAPTTVPTPPPAPADVALRGVPSDRSGPGGVTVAWLAVPGATSYLVARNGSDFAEVDGAPPGSRLSVHDGDLASDDFDCRTYTVRSRSPAGDSVPSAPLSMTQPGRVAWGWVGVPLPPRTVATFTTPCSVTRLHLVVAGGGGDTALVCEVPATPGELITVRVGDDATGTASSLERGGQVLVRSPGGSDAEPEVSGDGCAQRDWSWERAAIEIRWPATILGSPNVPWTGVD